jgi:hypothetical protein
MAVTGLRQAAGQRIMEVAATLPPRSATGPLPALIVANVEADAVPILDVMQAMAAFERLADER